MTAHSYIRCINKIYVGDANDNWRELHSFQDEARAKRWARDQEKKRPGSVQVGSTPPQITRKKITGMQAEYERRREIRKLIRDQEAQRAWDHRRMVSPVQALPGGKTAQLLTKSSYVAPDRDGSSFLRERSKKRVTSRNARNTRATYGGS